MAGKQRYRSALDDYPGSTVPRYPTVSLVIPVYNEIENIEKITAEILAQDYPQIEEIWFVDGLSTDGTFEALQKFEKCDPRVKVRPNPKKLPAAAVNLALGKICSDVVVRLDAHARYAPDVVSECVNALLSTGAGGVGAVARPAKAQTIVGRAIVAAHNSRLGVGVAKFRRDNAEGWVDSVWNGCYWMHVVRQVGALSEDLWRAEDNDFNERVRRLGYGLYLSPRIGASYQPRQSFGALWNQYFANGLGVLLALPKNPRAISIRHLIPMFFVLSLILLFVSSVFWPSMLRMAVGVLGLYILGLIGATAVAYRKDPGVHLLLLPLALLTLHFSYGLGSLYGGAVLLQRALFAERPAVENPS